MLTSPARYFPFAVTATATGYGPVGQSALGVTVLVASDWMKYGAPVASRLAPFGVKVMSATSELSPFGAKSYATWLGVAPETS